jgi:hypothetical protein
MYLALNAIQWNVEDKVKGYIANIMTIGTCALLSGFPLWTFYFLLRNKDKLKKKEIIEKYKVLY